VLCVVLLGLCAPASGRDWVEYRTDNFRVFSDEPARDVRRVLGEFEAFRQALLLVTGLSGQAVDERVRIFMYRDRRDFHALGVGKSVGGFFLRTDDGPVLVVGPERRLDSQQVLFHEYIHHLLYRHSPFNYPRWYSEGIAETFSVVDFDGRRLEFGLVPPGRAQTFAHFKALPLEDLLAARSNREGALYQARFYATAWLLTHYLMVGEDKDAQRAALRDYLVEYHAGRRDVTVFEEALGRSLEDVERALWSYRRQHAWPTYTVVFPRAPGGSIVVRQLAAQRARYEKARLALQMEAPGEALRQLDGERRQGVDLAEELPEALALRANVQHALAVDDGSLAFDQHSEALVARALDAAPESLRPPSSTLLPNTTRFRSGRPGC